jgi:hypothetical protein
MPERNEISVERLADWAEGRLSEEEARTVEEQVASADETTRAKAEWLRAFDRVRKNIVLDTPPEAVREELIRRFDAYAEGSQSPGVLQRFVASLSFDSGLQPALGVRSADAQDASQRQLIYTTDVAEIALNIRRRPRDEHLDLDGQVFPTEDADPASFSIQLLSGAEEVGLTVTDELGEFGFEAVAPGSYQVLVSSDRAEILISPVEVRA